MRDLRVIDDLESFINPQSKLPPAFAEFALNPPGPELNDWVPAFAAEIFVKLVL